MNLIREPIKNWFGFTRRERRSTFILLLLVVLIIGIKYSVPDSQIAIRDITGNVLQGADLFEFDARDKSSARMLYSPDRFNASRDTSRKARRDDSRNAQVLSSKGRVYIFSKNLSGPQKQLTDLNMSDSAALEKLPGIGPVLSSRIIKYRHLLGGFARISQLREVYGLPEETFNMIKDRVFADSTAIRRIDINSAGYKELIHLHYFEKNDVTAILKYRELKGRITGINDLTENKLITVEKASKVRPYLSFEE